MANHRTPDGADRHGVLDSAVRTTGIPAPCPISVWTYGSPAPSTPPRIADVAADVTAPARPAPRMPAPLVPVQAGPAPLSPAHPWPAAAVTTAVANAPDPHVARRSAADDIASRATTTLIPSSPGARRSRSGPVFVDGSGRRARWFTGVAAATATLAAGYVGIVVTGALAGPTGPAGTAVPVASGASLAPATPVLGPPPAAVQPSEVTTKKPASTGTTTPKRTTRVTPKKVAPKVIAPVAPPVVPAPAAPVVPPPPAPVVPPVPAAPATPPTTTKPGAGTGAGTGTARKNRAGTQTATPGTVSA